MKIKEAVDFHSHIQDIRNFSPNKDFLPFVSGYSIEGNEKVLSISKKLKIPYYIGIAPQEAQRMTKESIDKAVEFVKQNSKHAVGEIGMDFHWGKEKEQIDSQLYAFEKQLNIAEKLKLPVVIHSRKAEEFIVNLLIERDFSQKVAFHFYSGKPSIAKKALKHLDCYFSIIVFPSKERKKLIKEEPLERFMVETDSPYVAKDPSEVSKSISYIAKIKDIDFEKVKEQTSLNALSFIKNWR